MYYKKNRKRRVIYNDDASPRDYPEIYKVTDEKSLIDARTTVTFNTCMDTYVWDVGNGCEVPYNIKTRSIKISPERASDLIIEACHSKGIEVWGSLRINDIHDSFTAGSLEEANDPLKAQHPEYLISPESVRSYPSELTERYMWTPFNFAHPEVIKYRLDFIRRNAGMHDFDGYELNFTRFIWNFPLGEEKHYIKNMTEFISKARHLLNEIGDERGKPYTFAVYVMDSQEVCKELGLDVSAWVKDGLVDILVVGMGYMPYVLKLEQWLKLGKQYGIPVYPAVNTNTYRSWETDKFKRPSAFYEAVRASSAYFWQEGADGIYVFNLYRAENKKLVTEVLKEIGDPEILEGKNKIYAIQSAGSSGFCHHGSEAAPLPIVLDKTERKLPLKVGPDPDDQAARFILKVKIAGGNDDTKIWIRLNHTLLYMMNKEEDWLNVEVPDGLVRKGYNELNIWCNEDVNKIKNPVIVHEVFLLVSYQ